MGQVLGLAKQFVAMEPAEIEKLLHDPSHEVKVADDMHGNAAAGWNGVVLNLERLLEQS